MAINLSDSLNAATTKGKLGEAKQIYLDGDTMNLQQAKEETDSHLNILDNRSTQMENSIKDISVTGGASTANATSYDNTTSGFESITVQGVFDEIAKWKNKGYQFRGIATPTTNPGTPKDKEFYFTSEAGNYINFSNITIDEGLYLICNTSISSWAAKPLIKILQEFGTAKDKVVSQKVVSAVQEAIEKANFYSINSESILVTSRVEFNKATQTSIDINLNTSAKALRILLNLDKPLVDTNVQDAITVGLISKSGNVYKKFVRADNTRAFIDVDEDIEISRIVVGNYSVVAPTTLSGNVIIYKHTVTDVVDVIKQNAESQNYIKRSDFVIAKDSEFDLVNTYSHFKSTLAVCISEITESISDISVLFGRGLNEPRGEWCELTNTNFNLHNYWYSGDSVTTKMHSLNLVLPITICVRESEFKNIRTYTLTNGDGQIFEVSSREVACSGKCFIKSDNNSLTVKNMYYKNNCYKYKTWIYGDSWLEGYWLPIVYSSYSLNNFMASYRSGADSNNAISSFEQDISLVVNPSGKTVVWCIGMNDSSDVDVNTPDATWLKNTKRFLELCESKNIKPILQTIASCYGDNVWQKDHRGKNNWIRNSGYDYVDIDSLLTDGNGNWKMGLRYSETSVHTSDAGSKLCAAYMVANVLYRI